MKPRNTLNTRNKKNRRGPKGKKATQRIDLGLELLTLAAAPSASFTQCEIAAWAECSPSLIYLIERKALRKVRDHLRRGLGMTRSQFSFATAANL